MHQFSPHINTNKIFLVNFSELSNRFDPELVLYNRQVKRFNFDAVPLKRLLKKKPQYGANESGIERNDRTSTRYIRITDIDEYGLLNDTIGVTASKIESKYILSENDILFARSGATVGKAYIHKLNAVDYDCFFAGYMIRFVVDQTRILPDYLFAYTQLPTYKKWVSAIQRAAGQPNINAEEYKSLLVPLPPFEVQRMVVQIISDAYVQKKEKEATAKVILNDIDVYLLNELGCSLSNRTDSLGSRIFKIMYSDLNSRIDPIYYNSDLAIFSLGSYKSVKISSVVNSFKSGIGAGKQDQASDKQGIIQIRPTNVKDQGLLSFEKNVYLPEESVSVSELLKYNDVLFNNTNSQELVGKTAIVKTDEQLSFSNHITRIRVDTNQITPDYLCIILNAYQRHKIFYSICTNWNNQSGIGLELLRSLKIPLPSIDKQIEISNYIQDIYFRVQSLHEEARKIIEEAKQEIEQLIIGEQ